MKPPERCVKASERYVHEAISEEERCVKASRDVYEGVREVCEAIGEP